jgi:excisionase family DNA binding protein
MSTQWETVKQYAERMQLNEHTVWRLIRAGKIKAIHVGRSIRINTDDSAAA